MPLLQEVREELLVSRGLLQHKLGWWRGCPPRVNSLFGSQRFQGETDWEHLLSGGGLCQPRVGNFEHGYIISKVG